MALNNHFNLTLDTTAPTGSIKRPGEYLKSNGSLTISATENVSFMKVWFNETATGTKEDDNYPTSWIPYATSYTTEFSTNGNFYYHVVFMDEVGNESEVYNTTQITFDTVKPIVTANSVYIKDPDGEASVATTITNQLDNDFGFSYTDTNPSSGVVSFKVTCNDFESPLTGTLVKGTTGTYKGEGENGIKFKAGTADGTKTITVYVYDSAGNESVGVTGSITLDTVLDVPTLTLKNGTANLADDQFINYRAIKANLVSTEKDIVGYKIWEEGSSEPAYTKVTKGSLDVTIDMTLSSGDEMKTVHAKIIDSAGNEKNAVDRTISVDTNPPTATLTRKSPEAGYISKNTGYNTAVLTIGASDTFAGVKSITLTCNGSNVEGAKVGDNEVTQATPGMKEGANTFVLTVVDNAENSKTATATVNLDTTPATASINALNTWYNDNFNITANTSDAGAGVASIYAWVSNIQLDQSVPVKAAAIAYISGSQEISSNNIVWDGLTQSAANYMHIKVVDKVGNVSYAHQKFGFDNVPPVDDGSDFSNKYYKTTSATVNLKYSDETSKVAFMKVTGDITNGSEDWEAIAASKSVTLKTGDGKKTVSVQFKDNAGNISTVKTITAELDSSAPTAFIELHVAGSDTAKPTVSNIATFNAWIAFTDDAIKDGGFKYLYYGAGIGVARADAEWKTFSATSGKKVSGNDAMVLPTSTAAIENDVNTVFVEFMDAAGNVSDPVSAGFTYDTTAPEPLVEDVDGNIISKVHALRLSGTPVVETTKYCDEIHFTIDPNGSTYQAWKVCAYDNETAAKAGTYEDDAIPVAGGSTNMSGANQKSTAKIACMIRGADYETALGGTGHDGLHIVVVYMQDEGGNWSAAAKFTA